MSTFASGIWAAPSEDEATAAFGAGAIFALPYAASTASRSSSSSIGSSPPRTVFGAVVEAVLDNEGSGMGSST